MMTILQNTFLISESSGIKRPLHPQAGLGDVKVKKFLYSVLMENLSPIQARRKELEKDIPAIMEILHQGSIRAKEVAAQTLAEVKHAMQIDYFE